MNVTNFHEWVSERMRAATKKRPTARKRKATPLTVQQLADARALEECWDAVERERRGTGKSHSKKDLAGIWGVNPSNVSQYINGYIPLNVEAQLYFADYLCLSPVAIWPDFRFKHLVPGALPPDAIAVATAFKDLADASKDTARRVIDSLPKKRAR